MKTLLSRFSVLAAFASLATLAGVSPVFGQPLVAAQAQASAAEAKACLVEVQFQPEFTVVKDVDVREFLANSGPLDFFGQAGGQFVSVSPMGGDIITVAGSFIEPVETYYDANTNSLETKGLRDGMGIQSRIYLIRYDDPDTYGHGSRLVLETSDPQGYEGKRYIFDPESMAISMLSCTCFGLSTMGTCTNAKCNEGENCAVPQTIPPTFPPPETTNVCRWVYGQIVRIIVTPIRDLILYHSLCY